MEGTNGLVDTIGIGTTLSNGRRSTASYTFAGGAPASPNPNFVLSLNNATPGAAALLAFGLPATPPLLPIGDGLLGLDLLQPFFLPFPTFTVPASGTIGVGLPIPAGFSGFSVAIGWGIVDPVAGSLGVSETLRITF